MVKSKSWYVLKRWNASLSSATPRDLEDHRINLFTTSSQVKKTLEHVGISLSKPTNKRHFLVNTEKAYLKMQTAQEHSRRERPEQTLLESILKSLHCSAARFFGKINPRLICSIIMEREEYGEGKEELMIQSIPHG